jgi:hypothetical protein
MGQSLERGSGGAGIGERWPDRNLLVYYVLESLLLGPLFPLLLIPRFLKYRTLRYHLEEGGVSARWGALFRREVSLSYSRIQDLHLASNLVERWLGLARIQVQTASGSSGAEMTLEGLRDYQGIRDWVYGRMRGARGSATGLRSGGAAGAVAAASVPEGAVRTRDAGAAGASDPAVAALREAAAELRRIRELLEEPGRRRGGGP